MLLALLKLSPKVIENNEHITMQHVYDYSYMKCVIIGLFGISNCRQEAGNKGNQQKSITLETKKEELTCCACFVLKCLHDTSVINMTCHIFLKYV